MRPGVPMPLGAVVILFCSCLILQVSNYAEAEIGGRHIRRITAADLPSSNITDATKVRLKKLQVRNGENCTTEPCSRSSTSAPPSSTVSSNKEETKKTVSFVADDVLQERLHSDVLSHLTTTSSPYAGGYSYFDDIVVSDRFGEETSHATKKSSAFNDDNYSGTEASNFGATLTTPRISLFDDIHARMTESIRQNLEEMDEHRFRDISRPHSDRSLEEQPSDTVAIHRSVSDVANEKTNESVALEFSSNLSIIYNNSASPSSVKKDLVVENGTHIELEKSLVHTKIEPEVNHTVYYISNDTHSTIIPNIESVLTKGAKDSRKETETLKSRPPVKISTTSESSINSIKHETVVTTERNDKSTSRDTPELSSSLSTASTNAIQNKTGTPGDKDSTTSEPTRGRSYSRSQKTINSLNKGDLKTSITKQSINDNSSFNSSESVSTKDPDSNAVAPVSTQNPRQANTNNRGSRMLVTRRGHYNTTNGQDQSSHSPISGSSENSFTSEDATKKPRVRYSTRRTGTSRSEEQIETSTVSFGTTTDYASAAKTEITEVPEDNAVLAQTIQNNTLVRNKNSNSEDVVTQTTGEPEESSTVEYTSSRGRAFSYRRPYTTDRSVTHDSEPSTGTDDSDETSTSRPSASSVNIEAVKRRLTTMRRRPQLTTETSVTINSTSNSTTESNVIVRGWPTIARRPSMEGKAPTNKTDNTDNNEGNDIISVRGNVYKSVTRNRGTVRYGSQRNDTSVLNQKNDTYSFPIPPTAAAWTLVTLKGPSNETRSVRHPVQGNNSTNSTKQTTAGRWPLIRNRRPWNTMKQESTTVSAESTRGSVSTSPKSTKLSAVPEEKQATRLRISRPQKKIQQPSMQENRMSTIQVLAPTTEQELEQTTENVLFSTTENDADIITTQSPQTTTSSDELTTSSDSSFESISATSIRNNINMMVTAINTSDMITSEINSNSFPSSASYVTSTLPTTSTDYAVTLTTEALESTTENPQWENTGTDNQTTESSSRVSVATEANISSSTNNAEDISTTTTENSSQGVTTLPGPFITAGSLSGFMEEEIINPPLRGEGDQQPENQEGDAGNNAESYQGIVNAEEVNNQGDESKQGVVNVEGSQQEESNRPPEETRGDGINSEGTHVQGEIPVGSSDEDENKNADGNRQLDESQNSGKQPPAPVGGDEPFPAQEEPADYGGPDSGTIDHNSDGVTAVPSRIQTDVPISNGTLISGTKSIEFETIATPRFEQTTTLSSSTSAIEWGADSTTLPSVSKVPFYLILTVIASWSSFCDRKDQFKQAVVDLMRNNQRSIATYQIMLPNADSNCPNNGVSRKTARSSSIEVEMYLVDGEINFDRQLTSDFYDYWRKSGLPGFPLEFTMQPVGQTSDGGDDDSGGGGGMIAAITISCIGAVCLLLLAILWLVMRKRQQRFNYGQRCTPVSLDAYSLDSVSVCGSVRRKGVVRNSKRSYGNAAFDDPSTPSHPMGFAGLANFVLNREALEEEFANIPQVTANVDELPEGADTKNRYANVIPLPETRVELTPIEGEPLSEYINANFVHGPKNSSKYYIACQAPLTSTVTDFWRMIWEQQSKVILMLTDLVENGVEKSADYLPPSEVLDCHRLFGDFQITLKKREVKEKYIISTLQLKNLETNSWREVMHLWYVSWPTQGVPEDVSSVIAFLLEARPYMRGGPCVVHCSPGTGRTGTVLACDLCIRDFETTRIVDIPRCVARLRRDRAGAVQTRDQYVFIYQVINLYGTKLTGGALDSM